jgi:magnesium transporter
MDLSIIGYDPVGAWKKTAAAVDELLEFKNPAGITWINVDGLDDAGAITHLAEFFRIHPLTVEDILNIEQRPKLEEFEH